VIKNKITMLAIVGHEKHLEKTLKALKLSFEKFETEKVTLITCKEPKSKFADKLKIKEIPTLSYEKYNEFVLKELNNFVDTEFVLTIQDDGFIINTDKWNDCFLEYDYIGAPWPNYFPMCDINNVGNGGFSLRSKRFLEISQAVCPYDFGENEDVLVCRKYYNIMKSFGVLYADEKTASMFSIEHTSGIKSINKGQQADNIKTLDSFGFHYIKSKNIDLYGD
jgi:hypothetical protein